MALTAGKLYRQALRRAWPAYVFGTLTLLATSISEVLVPKYVQWSLDVIAGKANGLAALPEALSTGDRPATLRRLVLCFFVTLIAGGVGRFGWRQLLARRTHIAGRDLKVRFWDVLSHVPLSTFHRYPLGDLMNRATGDWSASRAIHGFTVVLSLDLIFFTLLAIGSMLTIDVELTAYCLVIFPFLPRLILKLARQEHDLHIKAQETLGRLSETIAQALATIRLQRATASDQIWQTSLAGEAEEYARRRFLVARTAWRIFPLGALPTLIAYGILLWLGVRKITAGEMSVGQFVAMQSYVLMLQGPLFDMGDCIAEWQKGIASLKRLVEIFNLQSLADAQRRRSIRPTASGDCPVAELRQLNFVYDQAQGAVLKDLSLAIAEGETIGIYGPIGGGKSTLLKILSGLVDAPRGTALLHGTDVLDAARDWLAGTVTMVPQRAFLFAGSIRSNLELDESFGDDELWRVLRLVQLEDDVRQLEDGLDAWIGEWGVNLSGGQKQRLSLARALLRQRELVLLDDCLSAVDAVTEEAILSGMRGFQGGAGRAEARPTTVVWAAHRMSTLRLCDRIFYLEAGVLTPVVGDRDQGDLVGFEGAGQKQVGVAPAFEPLDKHGGLDAAGK